MFKKLSEKNNLTEFENKIAARLKRGRLLFGNKLQLAEVKILNLIDDLKYNEEFFQECYSCQDKISIIKLIKIDNCLYCDNCISEKFTSCSICGDYIYNDDIQVFEGDVFCDVCIFEAKQKAYNEHKILNPLLILLQEGFKSIDLTTLEFKIGGHIWSIEKYSGNNYRLGSWGANSWVDIGDCRKNLLQAIDYYLGKNRNKLTNIYLKDNTELKLT